MRSIRLFLAFLHQWMCGWRSQVPDAIKAKRSDIPIGSRVVDGFMLPDDSYRMSQEQSASAIGLKPQNASIFLRSKALKKLVAKGYTEQLFQIENGSSEQARGANDLMHFP